MHWWIHPGLYSSPWRFWNVTYPTNHTRQCTWMVCLCGFFFNSLICNVKGKLKSLKNGARSAMNVTVSLQPICFAGSPDHHSGVYSSANYAKTHHTHSCNVLCWDSLHFGCQDWNAKLSRGKSSRKEKVKERQLQVVPLSSLPITTRKVCTPCTPVEPPLPSHLFQSEQVMPPLASETTFQIQLWVWIARDKSNRVRSSLPFTSSRWSNDSEKNPELIEPHRIFPIVFGTKNMPLSGSYH